MLLLLDPWKNRWKCKKKQHSRSEWELSSQAGCWLLLAEVCFAGSLPWVSLVGFSVCFRKLYLHVCWFIWKMYWVSGCLSSCYSVVPKFWPSASGRPLTAQLICVFGCIKVVCNISVCRGSLKGLNVETVNHVRKLLLPAWYKKSISAMSIRNVSANAGCLPNSLCDLARLLKKLSWERTLGVIWFSPILRVRPVSKLIFSTSDWIVQDLGFVVL